MNPCLTKTSLLPPPLTQWLRLIKITSLFLVPHLQHIQCIKAHTPAHIWNSHPTTLSHPTFLLQFLHSPMQGWQSQSKPTQMSSAFTYTSGFSQDCFELVFEDTRTKRSKTFLLSHQHSLWQRWDLSCTDQSWPDMWWGEAFALHCAAQGSGSDPHAVCRLHSCCTMGWFRNLLVPLNSEILSHARRRICMSLFIPALRCFGQQKFLIRF